MPKQPKPYTMLPDAPVGTTQVRYLDHSDKTEKVRFEAEAGTPITFFTATGQIEARVNSRGELEVRAVDGWLVVIPNASNSITVELRP